MSIICSVSASGQGFTDKVYLPNPTTGLAATCCTTSSTLPDWYVNLEKYWYYRYMAVNDFIYVGTEAGESIPAATWQMTHAWTPHYSKK
jgi:hypothetical protein